MDWEFAGVIAGFVAVVVALYQLRSQIELQTRERAVEAYFRFTDRFSELSQQYHAFVRRAALRDTSVLRSDAEDFFREYWQAQLQQWEFVGTGLLPAKIYARWLLYANDYMFAGRDFPYYSRGKRTSMSALSGYENIGRVVLRNQPEALNFFDRLLKVSTTEASRFEIILAQVNAQRRNGRKRWSN